MSMTDEQYQATLYALASSRLRRAIGRLDTLSEVLADHRPDNDEQNTLAECGRCAAGAQADLEAAVEALGATRLGPRAPEVGAAPVADPVQALRVAAGAAPAPGATP